MEGIPNKIRQTSFGLTDASIQERKEISGADEINASLRPLIKTAASNVAEGLSYVDSLEYHFTTEHAVQAGSKEPTTILTLKVAKRAFTTIGHHPFTLPQGKKPRIT